MNTQVEVDANRSQITGKRLLGKVEAIGFDVLACCVHFRCIIVEKGEFAVLVQL